jgi:hypothetical protein
MRSLGSCFPKKKKLCFRKTCGSGLASKENCMRFARTVLARLLHERRIILHYGRQQNSFLHEGSFPNWPVNHVMGQLTELDHCKRSSAAWPYMETKCNGLTQPKGKKYVGRRIFLVTKIFSQHASSFTRCPDMHELTRLSPAGSLFVVA